MKITSVFIEYLQRYKANAFFRNIALVLSGNATAKLIGIITAPIITRLYTPEDYGAFSVFASVIAILGSVATLRYSVAIPLPREEKESDDILKLSFVISFLISLIISLAILISGSFIAEKLAIDAIKPYLWFIPFAFFGIGLYNGLTNWAVRHKRFRLITRTKVTQGISSAGIKIGLGFLGIKPMGLIIGAMAQELAGITSLLLKLIKEKPAFFKHFNLKDIVEVAKRYKRFPLIQTWSQFLLALGAQLPVLLMGSFYGATAAGIYGLAHNIINMPMNLIGQTVSQVYFGEISRIGNQNPKKIYQLSLSIIKKLFWVGLVPVGLLVAFGPWLFSVVFGTEWHEAGIYARFLTLLILTRFISSPIASILIVFEKEGLQLILNVVRVILVIFIFWGSSLINLSALNTIGIYSLVMTIYYAILSFILIRVVKKAIN